jgi:tetratricopeptide (TPR) repeat protein
VSKRTRTAAAPVPAIPVVSVRLALGLLVIVTCLAYANTLRAPFLFDDIPGIERNESIRNLAHLGTVLSPPSAGGTGVAGRPVVNLTLAINYAISGLNPWSYHLANLAIHTLATVALFGVARRAMLGPVLRAAWGHLAPTVAFVIALLWALHPLQTESVTCTMQRTESLVGLFYLATLYAFIRATEPSGPARAAWAAAAIASCAAGMGTKEVMVTAPLIVWLFDRTFLSGTFRGTARNRHLHYGLAATWALLFLLLQGNPMRGGTAGYEQVTSWDYLLTQCRGIVLYLKLAVWPHPLVLDYGRGVTRSLTAVLPQALLLVTLFAGTVYALGRKPVLGFLGAWFFIILSPSSSVVPLVTQTIAEHRMYLPLAALVALGVGGLALRFPRPFLPVSLGLAALALLLTVQRNSLYNRPLDLWLANRAAWPENGRVYGSLANVAHEAEDFAAAVAYYEAYREFLPEDPAIRFNYARDLVKVGRREDALGQFEAVLAAQPNNTSARTNYAACLLVLGRHDAAIEQFQLVLRLKPRDADDHFNLAEALRKAGRAREAVSAYQAAAELSPQDGFKQYRLGDAYLAVERPEDAARAYRAAVDAQPDLFAAWMNLGGSYLMLGRVDDAVWALEHAVQLKPGDQTARQNLEYARRQKAGAR